jgi:hypothetical protein
MSCEYLLMMEGSCLIMPSNPAFINQKCSY